MLSKEKKKHTNEEVLVSIITPMYNDERYIISTIKSVLKQTYQNWELILIDDASTDHTLRLVESLIENKPQIKLLKNETNQGAAVSRNYGTEKASGHYIAFLDADDLWKANKLEKQIDTIKKTDAEVCFSSYDLIDQNGNALNKKVEAVESLNYNKLLKANYIGNLTGIYNCRALGKIYTKDLKKRQDWLLWIEALKRSSKPAIGIKESLAYYRITKNSLSSNKLKLLKHNFWVYRKGLKFSTLKSMMYLVIFLHEHLILKKRLIRSIRKK